MAKQLLQRRLAAILAAAGGCIKTRVAAARHESFTFAAKVLLID